MLFDTTALAYTRLMALTPDADPLYQAARHHVRAALLPIVNGAAPDADAIHQLRVCCKRLRALLQLYRPYAGHSRLRQLDRQLRQIAKALAGRRDLHVQQQLIKQLASELDAPLNPTLNSQLLQTSPVRPLNADDNEHIIAAFAAVLVDWPHSANGVTDHWQAGLQRTIKRARKLARRACNSDQDALYHRCRKWTKYALYQREQLHDNRLPADAQMQQLAKLGERLGELQDLCNLQAQLLHAAASADREALAAQLEQRKQHCKRRIIRLFIRVFGRSGFRY
ncbi:MAG: CHAD domain-containing protein [Pseudomonadaceae bacterium]